jgi:Probable Zinc-ribbon domain
MRRKPPQGRSLAARVPEVAAEWHPVLNGDLTRHDVFAGSDKRFWWQCSKCGHEWETKLDKRVKLGQGCRKCSAARRAKAQATPKPGQSLAVLMPQLAAEWHPTLNPDRTPSDVVPTSGALVWWLCPSCQHEWRTSVYRRSVGIGCHKCAVVRRGVLRATPKSGKSFADVYPDAAAEWHPTLNGDLKPTDVKPASNKGVWWRCSDGHEWTVKPADRQRGERCPECANRLDAIAKSTPKPGRSLADLFPDVAAEWHPTLNAPVTASEVNPGSRRDDGGVAHCANTRG